MDKNCFIFICILIGSGLYYCSDADNPVVSEKPDNKLDITTSRNIYIYEEWMSISGTVINTTGDTFYSKLGDAIIANDDQEYLYFAEGSDCYFQKYETATGQWTNMPRGWLIEGTKVVSLLPQKTYLFSFHSRPDSGDSGQYRFLLKYYRKTGTAFSTDTLRDTSNTFIIAKTL